MICIKHQSILSSLKSKLKCWRKRVECLRVKWKDNSTICRYFCCSYDSISMCSAINSLKRNEREFGISGNFSKKKNFSQERNSYSTFFSIRERMLTSIDRLRLQNVMRNLTRWMWLTRAITNNRQKKDFQFEISSQMLHIKAKCMNKLEALTRRQRSKKKVFLQNLLWETGSWDEVNAPLS